MFLGSAESIVSKNLKHDTVAAFFKQANQAYVERAQYLQKKLPLNSSLLQSFSAIDPIARGHSVTADRLKRLPKLVTNVLLQEEKCNIHLMFIYIRWINFCHHIQMNMEVYCRLTFGGLQCSGPINTVPFQKMVQAILSCFHGPQVESSFSMMGDVLDKESGNLKIETFSAIQTVKYRLSSQNKSAIDFF
ncbi:hypothetical protein AVEN_132898-1 [Araneus ventricosus]|uniref:Uncharacterized protein n=1 Tax=Araneus ventricosus TaxID=182803 RepID=A0A4Y2IRL7_ARAVE|nr:hypothetical protein AVEN_132898-1 [Araneus ventricosus]